MLNALTITAGGISGAIVIAGIVILFSQLQEEEKLGHESIELIMEDFHPEVSTITEIRDPDASDMIGLNARWDKTFVTMSVTYDDSVEVEFQQGSLERIKTAFVPGNGTYPYLNWSDLLYKLQEHYDIVPILEYTDDFENADIKLYLTNDLHPQGKIGFTRLGVDIVTKTIVFVEMYGFGLDVLVESNTNAVALQHGIGHALGLSHTDYPGSIMYPHVISIDGVAIGTIGPCEENAIMQIYVEKMLGSVSCKLGIMAGEINS